MPHHLRVSRPVTHLPTTKAMYCEGLGLFVIGSFEDHKGFDGVMLGDSDSNYHFEFTYCKNHSVQPSPTPEDLIVLYIQTRSDWQSACDRMRAAGFKQVLAFNPYWERSGCTFEDRDGYRVVLQNKAWRNE